MCHLHPELRQPGIFHHIVFTRVHPSGVLAAPWPNKYQTYLFHFYMEGWLQQKKFAREPPICMYFTHGPTQTPSPYFVATWRDDFTTNFFKESPLYDRSFPLGQPSTIIPPSLIHGGVAHLCLLRGYLPI